MESTPRSVIRRPGSPWSAASERLARSPLRASRAPRSPAAPHSNAPRCDSVPLTPSPPRAAGGDRAEIPPHVVDRRIIERNINKGLISRKDFEKYLKDLPDAAPNMEVVSIEDEEDSDEPSAE